MSLFVSIYLLIGVVVYLLFHIVYGDTDGMAYGRWARILQPFFLMGLWPIVVVVCLINEWYP